MIKELNLWAQNSLRSLELQILHPKNVRERKRKLKNAKRKILIDCGSNLGRVLEDFVNKRHGYIFYAFEPQPELSETLDALINKYKNTSITLLKKAVWIKNETLKFYLATKWGSGYKDGSTLISNHTNNSSAVDYNHPIEVEAIDFNEWFLNTVMPEADDYIVIKMDIEGAEYDVLEKMLANDSFKYVSELMVEFHNKMNESISNERHLKLLNSLKANKSLKLTIWK